MLRLREVIPPLTVRTATGQTVHAWDYKQKKSLVIAFLRGGSAAAPPQCRDFLTELAARTVELGETEAVALVVFAEPAPQRVAASRALPILVSTDTVGRSQRAFLGDDAFGPGGLQRLGVFVTDRYGELQAQWSAADEEGLPSADEILSWLGQIQVACEECGAPHWPGES